MECAFSQDRRPEAGTLYMDGNKVLKNSTVRYLGSIIDIEGEIDEDISN